MPSRPSQSLPRVTLKAAVTLDGRIATRRGDSKWITGEPARRYAHRLRARHDAVLVGVGTVRADDPELTVRLTKGRDPIRVVLDSDLRTPRRAKLVQTAGQTPTWIVHAKDVVPSAAWRKTAVTLIAVPRGRDGRLSLGSVLRALAKRGVASVLVEGGAQVHAALLDAGLVDRVAVFVAPVLIGDARALSVAPGRGVALMSEAWRLQAPRIKRLGCDMVFEGVLAKGGT